MEDLLTNMYIYNVKVFMATATPYIIDPISGVDISKIPKDITDYVRLSKIKLKHILDGDKFVLPEHPTLDQSKEAFIRDIIAHGDTTI